MRTLFLLLYCITACAQDPVAPTPEKVGPVRGETSGDYNVVQSWELGYRFNEVGGSDSAYRAAVNYGNGLRLLGSGLTFNSKDGHGRLFDEMVLTTQGLGSDPYESVVLRLQKNRLYDYNLAWRLNDYYNPNLVITLGEHFKDTERRWQDHEITLFPQSWYRIRAGYSRNVEDGPALTTEQTLGQVVTPALLFTNVRREYNSYLVGGDIELFKIKLSVLRRWDLYKEDTPYSLDTTGLLGKTNASSITSLNEAQPYHGITPGWLGNLFTERRWFHVNGRVTYSGGRRNSLVNEYYTGGAGGFPGSGTAGQLNEVVVYGTAKRPVLMGDGSITVLATKKLTFVENNSYSSLRMDGNDTYTQYSGATGQLATVNFQYLGIRLFTTSLDARYQFTPKFGAYTSYQYSDRLIRSIQSATSSGGFGGGVGSPPPGGGVPTAPSGGAGPVGDSGQLYRQSNHLNAEIAGFNWTPWQPLRVHLQGEIGRNEMAFTPVSERNYHAIDARIQYRLKKLQLSAVYREKYNNNSVTVTAYSSRSRNSSANATWTALPWLSLDAGYSHLHLNTIGGLAFFAGSPQPSEVTGDQSVYISNIHAANLGIRLNLRKRTEAYIGYSVTRDVGDGRASNTGPTNAVNALLYSVQTFPLNFQSPSARLTIRLSEKFRFNLGYQYYGYKEDFGVLSVNQNFRANTGYSSLLFSF